ncbi:type II toxin-antitoxin system PemK/MazF family toxin [Lentilactobacillus rapi]|uniref:type II toxin-antitoxin system PemK/MazF family toxin n=1 Tax=Lentilactobacillus rapi TaxID=481723 RepID=UPI000A832933|nr:type II toxin-antitoxin system PemK/MazF family toxin [Lentilactobacillus rapi]
MVRDKNQKLFEAKEGKREWYDQGSVIWCDFDPAKGHEQQKKEDQLLLFLIGHSTCLLE